MAPLRAQNGATPNWRFRGSEDREGASDSVPVLGQGRGGRWLGCGCSQPLVCQGAACQLWRLLEEFPVLRGCLVALFALRNLDIAFALVSFSPSGVWVLPAEYVVLGTRALLGSTVDTCSTGGLDEFQAFLRCGELES